MKRVLAAILCANCLLYCGCSSKDQSSAPASTVARSGYEQPVNSATDATEIPSAQPAPEIPPVLPPIAQPPDSSPAESSPAAIPEAGMADAGMSLPPPPSPTPAPPDLAPPNFSQQLELAPPASDAVPATARPENPLRTIEGNAFPAPRIAHSMAPQMPRSYSMQSHAFAPRGVAPPDAAPFEAASDAVPQAAPEMASLAPAPAAAPFTAPPFAALPPVALPPVALPPVAPAPPAPATTLGSAPVLAQGADAAPVPSPPAVDKNSPFDVVQVFYGTDRQSLEPVAESWAAHLHRFVPTGGAVLVALLFAILASSLPAYRRVFSTLAACGVATALVLGTLASSATLEQIRQSAQEGVLYTTERSVGGQVELGICEVTIPKTHKSGELEAPSITRLEVRQDARKHVVLRKTERLQNEAFYRALRARVGQSSRKELFVFIHGFNTSFEDAARRTAQMAHDLPFEGAPIFYSWPANKMYLLTYPADETNVAWTVPHLKQFLLDLVRESEAESINLVAHSMGNRALTTALRELELEFKGQARLFNQVVLAAPDIDAADFRDHIAPAIRNTAQRVTLYASSADQALAASQLVHRYPRAGDTRPELVLADGLDTIDVSHVGSSPWGHSYYGASDPILHDLRMLMQDSLPPMQRHWLSQADYRGQPYWIFQSEIPGTATRRESATPR